MNDWFEFKDVSSEAVGLVVTEMPEVIIPEERVTFTAVPGRSGSLSQREGVDVFNDIILPFKCFCADPADSLENGLRAFLRGSGALRYPVRPDGYYQATVINQVELQKILRGHSARDFVVSFRCSPLFRLDEGEEPVSVTSGTFLENPTDVKARPLITITGSGDITLIVGTQIVELTDIEDGISLDCEMQEAYRDGELLNDHMSGDFPLLGTGSTAISWSGGTVTQVVVTPRWVDR